MGAIKKRFVWAGLLVVAVAYLFQLPTPLRVNTDGAVYLTLAGSFNDGHGLIWHHHKSHYPSGYPLIVAGLERVGLGSSIGLVAWNYLMMAIAFCAGVWLLKRWLNLSPTMAVFLSVMYLLSWATIRYALIPGSEMTYIAISFVCLICLTVAENKQGNQRWIWWGCAVVLVPLAMSVRLVGVVLPPAVIWAVIVMFWHRRSVPQISVCSWMERRKGLLITAGVVGVLIVGCMVWAVTRTSYFREDVNLMAKHGIWREAIFTFKQRFLELASMFSNMPSKNVLMRLHRPMRFAGVPCLLVILVMLCRRIKNLTSVDVYLIAYVCLLLVWPYDADVRFWLPVEVLLFGLIARELIDLADRLPQRRGLIAILSNAWIAVFVILGLASMAWNYRLTYSGDRFSELWDLHSFRDTYRAASANGLPVNPKNLNSDLFPVLKRFGARDFNK